MIFIYRYHKFIFFNDTATTEIYTLSLHDALPIWKNHCVRLRRSTTEPQRSQAPWITCSFASTVWSVGHQLTGERSEEHTSELQSRQYLVCRLLLEKKKMQRIFCLHLALICFYLYSTFFLSYDIHISLPQIYFF